MNRLEAMQALFDGKKVTNTELLPFTTKYFKMGGANGEQVMYCDSESQPEGTAIALRLPNIVWSEYEVKKTLAASQLTQALTAELSAAGLPSSTVSSVTSGVKSKLGF